MFHLWTNGGPTKHLLNETLTRGAIFIARPVEWGICSGRVLSFGVQSALDNPGCCTGHSVDVRSRAMGDADRAERYRNLAAGFREQATDCREYDLRQQMSHLAEEYERLAVRVEWDTAASRLRLPSAM